MGFRGSGTLAHKSSGKKNTHDKHTTQLTTSQASRRKLWQSSFQSFCHFAVWAKLPLRVHAGASPFQSCSQRGTSLESPHPTVNGFRTPKHCGADVSAGHSICVYRGGIIPPLRAAPLLLWYSKASFRKGRGVFWIPYLVGGFNPFEKYYIVK